MGAGNICVSGIHEGLYYISKKYLEIVNIKSSDGEMEAILRHESEKNSLEGEYDEILSEYEFNNFVDLIAEGMVSRFSSFFVTDRWEKEKHIICENNLFKIAIADNEWSYAVLLLEQDDEHLAGLQGTYFEKYFNELKTILLSQFPEIGIYSGPWTHGTIRRNDKCLT